MSTFSFFSSHKRKIARLVEQSRNLPDDGAKQEFSAQVGLLFDELIERRLSKTECTDEQLRHSIHFELCGLISTLPASDTYFVEQYKIVLDELVEACRWKHVLTEIPIPFAQIAESSVSRQTDVRQWITRIRERRPPDHLNRLALMLTEEDQQAVAYRTLRAFLACLSKQSQPIPTTALFWLRNDRVQLRIHLVREYLFEQIAFYVYLVHTTNEATFIEESLTDVRNWVMARVAERQKSVGPELTEGINEIISQVKVDFIAKCQRKQRDQEAFYLDAKLSTMLIGFVKKCSAINKLLAKQNQDDTDTDEEPVDEDTSYNNELPEDDDLPGETDPPDSPDPWEEQRNRLYRCLALLEEKCQVIIRRHFNNGLSQPVPFQTLAFELGESAKTLESRFYACMEKLKNRVHGALY